MCTQNRQQNHKQTPEQKPPKLNLHQQVRYRIIVQGLLSKEWQDYFSGFTVNHDPKVPPVGVTILTSEAADHSLLLGAINNLYTLGFPLLKVEWLEEEDVSS